MYRYLLTTGALGLAILSVLTALYFAWEHWS